MKHLVTGVAGMIGSHLARRLIHQGEEVVGVDNLLAGSMKNINDLLPDMEFHREDCRDFRTCIELCKGKDRVWTLAANMGGMALLTSLHADLAYDNSMINLNMIKACQLMDVERMAFSSSACVYSELYQQKVEVVPLKEEHAYPSMPNEIYGWEKLYFEQVCEGFREDYGTALRIPRFHNVMGCAYNAYDSLRGKAPAHMVIKAIKHPEPPFLMWGDGKQTRSFLYIDDCIDGILKLMESDWHEPINIGSDRLVTMEELARMALKLAGKEDIEIDYDLTKPQGVRGRNADLTLVKEVLGWSPKYTLEQGMELLYNFAVENWNELEGI